MNTQVVIARQGETLDALCWRVYGKAMQGSQVVEQALLLNAGLADRGEILPHGLSVIVPSAPQVSNTKEVIQLWD